MGPRWLYEVYDHGLFSKSLHQSAPLATFYLAKSSQESIDILLEKDIPQIQFITLSRAYPSGGFPIAKMKRTCKRKFEWVLNYRFPTVFCFCFKFLFYLMFWAFPPLRLSLPDRVRWNYDLIWYTLYGVYIQGTHVYLWPNIYLQRTVPSVLL